MTWLKKEGKKDNGHFQIQMKVEQKIRDKWHGSRGAKSELREWLHKESKERVRGNRKTSLKGERCEENGKEGNEYTEVIYRSYVRPYLEYCFGHQ